MEGVLSSSHPVENRSLSSEKLMASTANQLEAGESENIVNVECAGHENNFKVDDPELKITHENDFKEGGPTNTVDNEQAFERTLSETEARKTVATKEEMSATLECLRKTLRDQETEAKIVKKQLEAEIEIYKTKNQELQSKMTATMAKATDLEAQFESSEETALKLGQEKSKVESDFAQFQSTFLIEKAQLLAKLEELQSINVVLDQDSLDLKKALSESETKIEELRAELEVSKMEILKSAEEKDQLGAQYADITNNFENQIDQLNTTILKLEESLAGAEKCFSAQHQEMQTELDAVRSEKDETHRRLMEMQTNLLDLQSQCQSLEKDAIKSTLEKEEVSQAFAEFQKSAQEQEYGLNKKIEELEAVAVQNQTDLDSQTAALEKNLQETTMDKEQLEKHLQQVKLEVKEQEVIVSETRQEKQDLENSLDQLKKDWQSELEELRKQSEQEKLARELLEGQIQELQSQQSKQEADWRQKEAEADRNIAELEVTNINLTENSQLLTKNLENFQSEKNELQSALSDANSRLQELEKMSLTFQQNKETEITNLVELLKAEAEHQESQLKVQISELQNSIQAAELSRSKQNDGFNEVIAKQGTDAAHLQAELSNKETQLNDLQHEHGQLKTNFEEAKDQKLGLEKSIYHLSKALKDRDRELQSRISEVENSLEATQGDLATQKEGFQRSLESHISENGGLRQALSKAEKTISDARKEKEEMAGAFLDFRKTTEFHKEQLQGRIAELETSYHTTEAKLAKQNNALKNEIEDYRAKEDHMIQALAQAEVKLRQLQLPRANSSVGKRSSSHHKNSGNSASASFKKLEQSSLSAKKTESILTKKSNGSRLDTAKKLEARKSESLKKERVGDLVKKLESVALTKRTETSKRLDSTKKLVEPPRTAPRDPSASSVTKGTISTSSSVKKRVRVPSTIFSDTSFSNIEPTSTPPPQSGILTNLLKKSTTTAVKKASGESSPGKKSSDVDKDKEILRGLRDKFFGSRANV